MMDDIETELDYNSWTTDNEEHIHALTQTVSEQHDSTGLANTIVLVDEVVYIFYSVLCNPGMLKRFNA